MREFIVFSHTAPLTPTFPLDDLPGKAGRLDVLCRCVTSALLTSHDLRPNVQVRFLLQNRYVVRFDGNALSRLNPDERSTAALFKKAIEYAPVTEKTGEERETTPGVFVSATPPSTVLEEAAGRGTVYLLHEDGTPITDVPLAGNPVFVLSDHQSLEAEERTLIDRRAKETIRLSPQSLHAHQAITIAHHYLDREE